MRDKRKRDLRKGLRGIDVSDSHDKANRLMLQIEARSPNGEDLAEFRKFCEGQGYSPNSIANYHKTDAFLQKVAPARKFSEVTAHDIAKFMEALKDRSRATGIGYRTSFKRLLKWMIDRGRGPSEEILSGLDESEESKNWRPKKRANLRLPPYINKDELTVIQQAAPSVKWKAFFSSLYATAARAGELLACNIGDVEIRQEEIMVGGEKKQQYKAKWKLRTSKTEPRGLPWIKEGVPDLRRWLAMHPSRDNPEAPLFINEWGERLSYPSADRMFRYKVKPTAEANLHKKLGNPGDKVSLHTFRHARATDLAQSLTPAQMAAFFGWTQTSRMMAVYVNGAGVMSEDGMRHHYDEPLGIRPKIAYPEIECTRCGVRTTEGSKFCSNCGQPFTKKAAREYEERTPPKQEWKEALAALFRLQTLQVSAVRKGSSRETENRIDEELAQVGEKLRELGLLSDEDLPTVKSPSGETKLKTDFFEKDDGKPTKVKMRIMADEIKTESFGKGRRPIKDVNELLEHMQEDGIEFGTGEGGNKIELVGKSKELSEQGEKKSDKDKDSLGDPTKSKV